MAWLRAIQCLWFDLFYRRERFTQILLYYCIVITNINCSACFTADCTRQTRHVMVVLMTTHQCVTDRQTDRECISDILGCGVTAARLIPAYCVTCWPDTDCSAGCTDDYTPVCDRQTDRQTESVSVTYWAVEWRQLGWYQRTVLLVGLTQTAALVVLWLAGKCTAAPVPRSRPPTLRLDQTPSYLTTSHHIRSAATLHYIQILKVPQQITARSTMATKYINKHAALVIDCIFGWAVL